MEFKTLQLKDIKPYENNPRKNDKAVDAVTESIKQCGYIAPIIVDENYIILAGHTRYKALKKLGRKEAQCVIKAELTEEQKRKYRLLDNKTNELADWDFDLLAEELEGLNFGDFDFGFELDIDENADEEEVSWKKDVEKYTNVINIPQYEPQSEKAPAISELVECSYAESLLDEIEKADIDDEIKKFLKKAATRHLVFDYRKIAEYYAHAPKHVQNLMEKSALVIIDVDDAIKNGFAHLSDELAKMQREDEESEE